MYKPTLLLAFLFLISCHSPEARLAHLQHNFWEKFARQDFFEIKLQNETLYLPLPPSLEQTGHQKTLAAQLQKEANALEKDKLSLESQKQLLQLRAALADCVKQRERGSAFFDPSSCCISAKLKQFSEHPELSLLLEKIPAYYTQIEQRWQMPDHRFVSKAVQESQIALDLLKILGERSGGKMADQAEAAKVAVKDFIGLCQSALLQ